MGQTISTMQSAYDVIAPESVGYSEDLVAHLPVYEQSRGRQMNYHGTAVNREYSTERQRRANYTDTFYRFAYLPTERGNHRCEDRKREHCVASTLYVHLGTTIIYVYKPRRSGCSAEWID